MSARMKKMLALGLAAVHRALGLLGLYLDDLLFLAGGGCLVRAAWLWRGQAVATLVAGLCLLGCAVIVARSRRGGGR